MLWLIIGLFVGFWIGAGACAAGQLAIEKRSIQCGVVKLDSEYFLLTKIHNTPPVVKEDSHD